MRGKLRSSIDLLIPVDANIVSDTLDRKSIVRFSSVLPLQPFSCQQGRLESLRTLIFLRVSIVFSNTLSAEGNKTSINVPELSTEYGALLYSCFNIFSSPSKVPGSDAT
jgi:hypothetical protein